MFFFYQIFKKEINVIMLVNDACKRKMALSVNNHVHEVLQILDELDKNYERILTIAGPEKQNESLRTLLDDVRVSLTRIASSFLTSPINGKAFIPLPPENTSIEAAQKSLLEQIQFFSHSK